MIRTLFICCTVALLGCPGPVLEPDGGRQDPLDGGTGGTGGSGGVGGTGGTGGAADGGYVCTVEPVDTAAAQTILTFVKLALDSAGTPHVAYVSTGSTIKYATRTGPSTWASETVAPGSSYVSLAMSATDLPYLSWYDANSSSLMYASKGTGSWVTTTVKSGGVDSSLALNPSGFPQLAFGTNTGTQGLWVAALTTGSWASVEADPASSGEPNLSFTSNGDPEVVYFERLVGSLKLASHSTGAWVTQTIDTPGVGSGDSAVRDAAGALHVLYVDVTNLKLKYATNASGSWVLTTLDAAGPAGLGATSLAIDAAGHLHGTYYQGTVKDLGYVTNRSGAWEAMPLVTGSGDLGRASSVAVDSARDVMHVGFVNRTSGAVMYVGCRR